MSLPLHRRALPLCCNEAFILQTRNQPVVSLLSSRCTEQHIFTSQIIGRNVSTCCEDVSPAQNGVENRQPSGQQVGSLSRPFPSSSCPHVHSSSGGRTRPKLTLSQSISVSRPALFLLPDFCSLPPTSLQLQQKNFREPAIEYVNSEFKDFPLNIFFFLCSCLIRCLPDC